MQTIIVKLLTADEAVVTLKNVWAAPGEEVTVKAGESKPETLVFIADKTSKLEIKKAVGEAVATKIDEIIELKRLCECAVAPPLHTEEILK